MDVSTLLTWLLSFIFPVTPPPNIIIIVADDMGYNDVGFHGSNQIPTPNIDALAYNGIILDRFYTQCSCTPSRSALMTGNYPIRSGMQGFPMKSGENRSLPFDMTILPEHMKKLGYTTYLMGKWHLGAATRRVVPTGRGFDKHYGYWNGFIGYFNYTNFAKTSDGQMYEGMDLHDQLKPDWSVKSQYFTDLLTEKTVDVIDRHDTSKPLFLMMSHLAPHTGSDGYELGVPNVTKTNIKYSYIENPRRRLYAEVMNQMDKSVGQVMRKLQDKKMLKNSIVLFFSDNGAPTVDYFNNEGSNWPLRGIKMTDYEGGIRTAAAIFSPLLPHRGYVSQDMIHLVDLLPTLYTAAGGKVKDLGTIDGMNQWDVLSRKITNKRQEFLVNINEVDSTEALIGEKGRYKYLKGTYGNGDLEKQYGDDGRQSQNPPYYYNDVLSSDTNHVIHQVTGKALTVKKMEKLRSEADLSWCRVKATTVNCSDGCLFDIRKDPCENKDIKADNIGIVERLKERLESYRIVLVPQTNKAVDVNSNPALYNNTWCTWLDDENCFKTLI